MPNLKRDIKKLDRKTGRRTTIKNGIPHSREGQNGDITLRKTPIGHELFAKIDGLWYGTRLEAIEGAVRNTLHGKVIRKKEDKLPRPPKKDLDNIIKNPDERNSFTKGRRTINDIVSNIVTKNRTTDDVTLKNSKAATASPNLKLFNDTPGGTGASYIPTLQFIKSPKSGLTVMADGDSLGLITFLGDDDDSTDGSVGYGTIRCVASDVTHATKNSRLEFSTLHDGTSLQTMILNGKDLSLGGTVTATTGFSTTGTWTFDEYTSGTIGITSIQDSGTSFNDNDTSLMTAAAIADKIEAYGYSTTAGDITGVTAGTGMSGGGTTGTVTLTNAGVTSLVATANETTVSGATGAVTIGLPDDVTIGGDLTITGDIAVNGNNINFDASHSSIAVATRTGTDEGGYRATLDAGQGTGTATGGSVYLRTSLAGGSSNDTANTIVTLLGVNGNGNVGIRDGSKFNLDGEAGTGDTYLVQSSADILDIYTGGDLAIRLDENTGYVDIAGDWTLRNGWHGSKTKIKFYPHQFVESEDTAGRQFAVIEEDVSGKIGTRVTNTSAVLYGFFPIPSGFKATHVRCYADTGSDLAIDTFQHDIDDGDIGSSLGSGDASAEVDITDLNSTSTNSLLIKLTFSNTSTEFYGGYITIAVI